MSTIITFSIDHTKIDATLTDFPVMIKLDDLNDVWAEIVSNNDRKKLKVKTSPGDVECYVEIEHFDVSSKKGVLWTKIPSISSSADTKFTLEVGLVSDNTSYVGDTGDAPAKDVWDSNFIGVWHMAQDPNGDVADAIKDSTSNSNHGTPAGSMTSADLIDGKIGKAIDFDGGDDEINCGVDASLDLTTNFTLEASIKTDHDWVPSNQKYYNILAKHSLFASGTYGLRIYERSTNSELHVQCGTRNSERASTTLALKDVSFANGVWNHIVGTMLEAGKINLFINGVEDWDAQDDAIIINNITGEPLKIGSSTIEDAADLRWKDQIDEVRISDIARSAAWIKATYYSNWDMLITIPAPVAAFTSDETGGEIPLTINFTDQTTGDVTSWSWSFGDGGVSELQNPSHEYTIAGTYTVSLTVTSPGGEDTETKVDYITVTAPPAPVAEFTTDETSGVVPLTVNFTDQTTGNVTSWSWSFGDGGVSELQNPSHTYYDAGVYTVSLTATGPGGSDKVSKTITAIATGDVDGFDTLRGKYIFSKFPYWSWNPQEDFYHKNDAFNPIGLSFDEEIVQYPRYQSAFRLIYNTKALISLINKFFDYHLGQLTALWFPSFKNDFVLTSDIGASDTILNIEDIKYDNFYPQTPGTGRYIFIYVNDNTWFVRKVIEAPTSTSLLIDRALEMNISVSQIKTISILYLGRFSIDEIEWTYITPDVAYTTLYFVELPEEYANLPW